MPDRSDLVALETLGHPLAYSPAQIRLAVDIASALNRGTFVLAEAPRDPR